MIKFLIWVEVVLDISHVGLKQGKVLNPWLGTVGLGFPEWDKRSINTEQEYHHDWDGFFSQRSKY